MYFGFAAGAGIGLWYMTDEFRSKADIRKRTADLVLSDAKAGNKTDRVLPD